ncbi:MAG: glycosyltransferase family 2 protein [Caldilineaceae bacterium]|nr:glycosyltransferase family 2 protein [Caldilineaceae bacterium]
MHYPDREPTCHPPTISVIIPVYNGEAFLAEAITSVLAQSYQPREVIVVDDGSTDQTAQVARQFGSQIRYLYRPNGGPAAARNTGLTQARGEFVGFLDADDLWPTTSLARRLQSLQENPTAGVALGTVQILLATPNATGKIHFAPWQQPRPMLLLQCALVHRSVFSQIGTFDESYLYAEDVDWFMRVREAGIPILRHTAVAVFARRHRQNLTNQQAASHHGLAVALQQSLARRRDAGTPTPPTLPSWTTWGSAAPVDERERE